MRIFCFTTALVVCFAIAGELHAKPFDGIGSAMLEEIVAAKPCGTNVLAKALIYKLLDFNFAEYDSQDVRVVVAYGFAYASDDRSLQMLGKLRRSEENATAGIAGWAITMRNVRHQSDIQRMGEIAYALGRATNSIEKVMLAQSLVGEFKGNAVPVLLSAMRSEQNQFVRLEIINYLSFCAGKDALKELLHEMENNQEEVGECFEYFFDTVSNSPRLSTRARGEHIRRKIRARIKEEIGP